MTLTLANNQSWLINHDFHFVHFHDLLVMTENNSHQRSLGQGEFKCNRIYTVIYITTFFIIHISLSEKSKEKSLPSCLSGERSDTDIHIPSSLKCITRSAYKIQCVPSNTNNLQRSECRFEFSKALQLNEGKAKLYATTNRRIAYRWLAASISTCYNHWYTTFKQLGAWLVLVLKSRTCLLSLSFFRLR